MERQVRSFSNFLGDSPFPYIAIGAILLLLGIGGFVTQVGKEVKKKDESHAKRVVSLSSSGLIVAMGMSAIGFVLLAIGLTKLF